jgi:acyl-CoA synthetase (AMP-forming)/AMP-acid ligase II
MSVFNKEEIMTGLQSVLEPYAFPRVLRGTQKIPLTAAGKYDLAAIRLLLNP